MTLIRSISGIRGTIGGIAGEGLSPVDIVRYSVAFSEWIKKSYNYAKPQIVIGRDARVSGEMVNHLIVGAVTGTGIDVLNIGLVTTPTVEIAVINEKAAGGIIITASHNPGDWNALKLLNNQGEFLSVQDGKEVLEIAANDEYFSKIEFAGVNELGLYSEMSGYTGIHINKILQLPTVDTEAIRKADFTIAVDAVNSVGGIAVPELLKYLGVRNIHMLFCEPDGNFRHNPEPLPSHLSEISRLVVDKKADAGFAVDPDVDRLAIICEDGSMFGEEYSLVAVADYILSSTPGNTVSNLSSTRALKDITLKHGGNYYASAVGEVNVVEMMKKVNAVIGGEGNGGIIYPELHYGRDALAGIALFLSQLARSAKSCTKLRAMYPEYYMVKQKLQLEQNIDPGQIIKKIKKKFSTVKNININETDGIKLDFDDGWVHLRQSNTEPVIRIYAESTSKEKANEMAQLIINEILPAFIINSS
jgi:phosphomannomutase